ncbi:hypothetical protein GTZ99_04930 [Novosphingobium sp. FSY-8]|uniref:Dicarboxylate transport n=1 Tax=Novosphingobium ovatum TaxID=1908523 RepID=A0ABW9XBK5_9SPHN|nr:YdbH domain-containing protein [Novosphingobium ovatum]NBC35898.1 hypothetical protein [Novosphingobium ovatum]
MAAMDNSTGPTPPQDDSPLAAAPQQSRPWRLRRRWWALGVGLAALGLGWAERLTIADSLVANGLARLHLPGRYRVVELDATRAVLADVVLGDPSHPDFMSEMVELRWGLSGGMPQLASVRLVRPHLVGRIVDGQFSLGSLDPLWRTPSAAPFRMPDMAVAVEHGTAVISGDYGQVGVALAGAGGLRGGFAGVVAVAAPKLRAGDCTASAGLRGSLTISHEIPRFTGPLQVVDGRCGGLRLGRADLSLTAELSAPLDAVKARVTGRAGAVSAGGGSARQVGGDVRLSLGQGRLDAVWNVVADNIMVATKPGYGANITRLTSTGRARGALTAATLEAEGDWRAQGVAALPQTLAAMARAGQGGGGALTGVITPLTTALRRELSGGSGEGTFTLRRRGEGVSVIVPLARWNGRSGRALLRADRLSYVRRGAGAARIAGTWASAGAGLPQMRGMFQSAPAGGVRVSASVAPYRAGGWQLGAPELRLDVGVGGAVALSGRAEVSGALGDLRLTGLSLPLNVTSRRGGWQVLPQCADIGFDRIARGDMALDHGRVRLCPTGRAGGVAIAPGDAAQVGLMVPALTLRGSAQGAPISLRSGPIRLEGPADGLRLNMRDLALALGDQTRLSIASLTGAMARGGMVRAGIGGTVSGISADVAGLPVQLRQGAADWTLGGDGPALTHLRVLLSDPQPLARFEPVALRDGDIRVAQGTIFAEGRLVAPGADRELVQIRAVQDTTTGRGSADLAVNALTFDGRMQPDTLSALARGVVANVAGSVSAKARIAWDARGVTHSSGSVTTDGLDFAAPVGPVRGVAGTVAFTDLLGLVTAPHQTLRVASINPGIEVTNGTFRFAMEPGLVLSVEDARWPFLDGTLELLPTRLRLGNSVERRFALKAQGIDTAKFLLQMEAQNIAATGHFDGLLPLVFDANGGRIEGGELRSAAPGGSVSYLGVLTYKDLSPMGNYAFKALRSLAYREMVIGMDGSIAGEVVTRVRLTGVRQGQGTTRNFITRQLAALPIEFNINIRAPFYQLFRSLRATYDTAFVVDPRELGLVGADGRPIGQPAPKPATTSIQPSVSEKRP